MSDDSLWFRPPPRPSRPPVPPASPEPPTVEVVIDGREASRVIVRPPRLVNIVTSAS